MPPKKNQNKVQKKTNKVQKKTKKEYTDSRSYDALLNKIGKKTPLFIWFYGNWCGHCKIMEQDWVNLSKMVKEEKDKKLITTVQLIRIESKYLDSRAQVNAYPTLRLYKDGKISNEYLGERTSSSMLSYLKQKL